MSLVSGVPSMYRGDQGDVPPGRGRKIMREVTVTEVAEVLDEAAGLYESGTYGWVQGKYSYDPGLGKAPSRCMLGILDVAAIKVGGQMAVYSKAHNMIIDTLMAEIGSIPLWNDTPGRT